MRLTFLGILIFSITTGLVAAEPSTVSIQKVEQQTRLLVNGEPFEIKGVGGSQHLDKLAKSGGNVIRTWGIDGNTGKLLDEAHKHGIKVILGFWLGHERHGFDYSNWDAIIQQADKLFADVRKYKDHPALLLWALGNEMEGFTPKSNPAIYTQIEYLARRVKELDPNHPTMTITAEIGKRQIEGLNRFCPSIDIHGINSYGGTPSIPQRYKERGGVKPYIITEYGPAGTWESQPNKWAMPNELSSTAKAGFYKRSYQAVHADSLCLGSCAFVWGSKQESSATWFGMLLPSGEKLACVDELTYLWSGKKAANLCPRIESINLRQPNELLDPGATIEVELKISDSEDDALKVKWVLAEDWKESAVGGDQRATPPTYPEAILASSTTTRANIQLPKGGGTYRVYAYVYDGKGGAATANVSIKIKGKRLPATAKKLSLPLAVCGSEKSGPWSASGWMGDTDKLKLDLQSSENPKQGKQCVKVDFTSDSGWAGIAWQHPAGDWGDAAGGFDLTGAKRLSFWARGNRGGEKLTVGIGLIGKDKVYHDTVKKEQTIALSQEWKRHQIDLDGADLSRVKTGLFFSTSAQGGQPFSFFLDEVVFE